jgi:uncharacterized protein
VLLWIGFIFVGLLMALSVWSLLVFLMARARLQPPRLTPLRALFALGRNTPKDLGFDFEALAFTCKLEGKPVEIRGNLVPHAEAAGRLVIVLHGYADSSAGAAAWLPLLHRQGVNVLLLDLPGHGESGDAPCTAGWIERRVVWEVIEQLRATHAERCEHVVLYGLSMGAAVALAAAVLKPGIAAVIADSPYADFRKASVTHAALFGLPGMLFQRPATWLIEHWYQADFREVAPMHLLEKLTCPVLLIQAGEDLLISPEDRQRMAELAGQIPLGRSLTVSGAHHLLALSVDPDEYESAVSGFLAGVWERVE